MKNKIEPKTLSGFMELKPHDQILFEKLKREIEKVYMNYGFYPLDTPIIESSKVLLAKAGGDTEKQIYRFNKGDNDLSLRFDLTVPLAKYVASKYNDLIFPFKRYQIGKVFRGERAQKGRFREFYQCDIDIIGNGELSLLYDVEIPNIIYDIFKKLDFGDFTIKINNRKILSGFFDNLGLHNETCEILRIIDKIEKIGIDSVKTELINLGITIEKIESIIQFILIDGSNAEKIEKLKKLKIKTEIFNEGIYELEYVIKNIKLMNENNDKCKIDLRIARGLDYYTGTVYETMLNDYPSIGSVCSGGRYDDLATYYTDKKLPGVGISIGLTRLFYQLMEANILNKEINSAFDIVVLPFTDNYNYVFNIIKQLREKDLCVDTVYLNKIKSLLKYANKQNVQYAIIIGDDEIKKGKVVLKDMKDGIQTEMLICDAIDVIKNNIR